MGWLLQGKWLYFADDDCNLHRTWTDLKARVIKQYHLFQFQKLEERRPNLFRGLGELNSKAHVTILKKLHSYHAATLVKIWTGSVMTRSHRATLDANVDPTCECGQGPQTLAHLLYHCPLQTPVVPEIFAWRLKPPANSCALLATKDITREELPTWEGVCMRALSIVSSLAIPMEITEWKGHEVTVSANSAYAYCGKCMVSRRGLQTEGQRP